jgi:hypothetical protein
MRGLLALMLLVGACSAFDDFGAFQFDSGATDDGGLDGGGIAFGDPCTANSCMQYNVARPVMCITMMSGTTFRDGICTRTCTLGTGACGEYADAVCVPVNGVNYCLPHCTGGGAPCRNGYDCCGVGGKVSNGVAGACAPSDSSLCH